MINSFLTGYVFDPEIVTLDSGENAKKLVAQCMPRIVNNSFPGWMWAPLDTKTGKVEETFRPWNTSIPRCGELIVIQKKLSYMLFVLKHLCYSIL